MQNYNIMASTAMIASLVIPSYSLPLHTYSPWNLSCIIGSNETTADPTQAFKTLTYFNGSTRDIAKSETWSAVLQNDKGLLGSSVRCWCKDDTQYEWDSEELGTGNGWWTFTQHLLTRGDSCSCPAGQAIMVELDPHTCSGFETAYGFFNSTSSQVHTSESSMVLPELVGLSLGGLALLSL